VHSWKKWETQARQEGSLAAEEGKENHLNQVAPAKECGRLTQFTTRIYNKRKKFKRPCSDLKNIMAMWVSRNRES